MAGFALVLYHFSNWIYVFIKLIIRLLIRIFIIAGVLELLLITQPSKIALKGSQNLNIPIFQKIFSYLAECELSSSLAWSLIGASILMKWLDLLIDWCGTDYFEIRDQLDREGEGELRPRFFFCTSRHIRLSPNRYFFQYPILYIGFSTKFVSSIGSIFSVKESAEEIDNPDSDPWKTANWFTFFSVNPKSYMSSRLGFDKKARHFLKSNGVDETQYPHIYVVTAPNILPWEFNPVTYYYVYDGHMQLSHTILEVNNTFQESHAYLLPRKGGHRPLKGRYLYTHRFPKDFHISPFNKRVGEYEADISDPLRERKFDIKIALLNEEGKRRMTVHTLSLGQSLDVLEATWFEATKLVIRWMLCGVLVVPRTLWECWRIFRLDHSEIHGRPEPFYNSKARRASRIEERCRVTFLQFLEHRVDHYHIPVNITVTTPRDDVGILLTIYKIEPRKQLAHGSIKPNLSVEIKVKSHVFWLKALSNLTLSELRNSELNELRPEMRSIEVNDWDILIDILDNHTRSDEPIERIEVNSTLHGLFRGIWRKGTFFVTAAIFHRLHGEALHTSPIYLYYRLESSSNFDSIPNPTQDFKAYTSVMGGVTRSMLREKLMTRGLELSRTLGLDLYWLPTQ
ncbi:hypothetical protein H072_2270 [Dactylellina haptotyla CBS 200.50]|uniref:Uncharacterized protein n=1 Tax=Dactylellina haptotyla (strain CBS 200.50) TaxID=1284197 RepID=S8C7N3_DACHA|nr:hypothetical protein H072_2270 [Dactylellina haptotyla CBS 200.50]